MEQVLGLKKSKKKSGEEKAMRGQKPAEVVGGGVVVGGVPGWTPGGGRQGRGKSWMREFMGTHAKAEARGRRQPREVVRFNTREK